MGRRLPIVHIFLYREMDPFCTVYTNGVRCYSVSLLITLAEWWEMNSLLRE